MKKKSAKTAVLIALKYMGTEPKQLGSDLKENDSRLIKAFSWYNYTYCVQELRPAITEYMVKRNFSKADIRAVNSASDQQIGITACSIAQMLLNGNTLPDRCVTRLNNVIDQAITNYHEEQSAKEAPVVSIQQRIKNLAYEAIGDIEYIIDMCDPDETIDTYQFLVDKNISPKVAVHIKDYYQPQLDELQQAIFKKDIELSEGYLSYTKDQLKGMALRLGNIISDVDRIIENKLKVRKPRKARTKKIKSADQLAKKVKYQVRFDPMKLVSVSPEQIVGAQILYTYNTKYRVLTKYQALDRSGLNIKGTTIIGFDQDVSEVKKLRKPEPVIESVLNGGKVTLRSVFKDIKAKSKKTNGRLNNTTILLRVLK